MVKIKWINHSIAYIVGNQYIEINKKLKEDPILFKAVLEHEKEHLASNHKYMDFWHDFKLKWYSWRLFKWCLRHPRSFFCYSPILVDKGKIAINPFMLLMLLIISLLVAFDIVLLKMLL